QIGLGQVREDQPRAPLAGRVGALELIARPARDELPDPIGGLAHRRDRVAVAEVLGIRSCGGHKSTTLSRRTKVTIANDHSSASAATGATRGGRRAGRKPAATETTVSSAAAIANVAGSFGPTPNRTPRARRPRPAPAATPIATAIPVSVRPRPTISRSTRSADAPSAMRMPISCVRSVTAYDITP